MGTVTFAARHERGRVSCLYGVAVVHCNWPCIRAHKPCIRAHKLEHGTHIVLPVCTGMSLPLVKCFSTVVP